LCAGCLFLLLKNHLHRLAGESGPIIIDNEFDGHQPLIKSALLRHIRRDYAKFPTHKIVIDSIGKKSAAHHYALTAKRGKKKVSKVITQAEIVGIFAAKKRQGVPYLC